MTAKPYIRAAKAATSAAVADRCLPARWVPGRLRHRSIWRTPDQDRRARLRRLEISFSQGAEWKALISKYIGTIPLSGDASCAAEQSISGGPPPRMPVSSAMIAKAGAAARHRQSAAPKASALPLPALAPAVSRGVAIVMSKLVSDMFNAFRCIPIFRLLQY